MAIGLFLSSIAIDVVSLIFIGMLGIYFIIVGKPEYRNWLIPKKNDKSYRVSIIIPAYNEEKNIELAIKSAFNQTLKPRQVIVIDDNSTDKTYEICKNSKNIYKNLKVIRQKENKGKAHNVSYVLNKYKLGEFTMVLDADTYLSHNFLEEITKPFFNKRVAIVTGKSFPIKQKNFFGRVIYNGSIFQYKFFAFRKMAQSYRNAVSVISGDSSVYRTSFLREVGGLPQGTQTEDMDITWIALEKGYRVVFQRKALARSKDAATFKGHWKQITRWYAGGFQGLVRHGRSLLKAKPLLFTTLLPVYFDSFIYSAMFIIAPLFFFISPKITIGFYVADLIITSIVVLIIDLRGIIHLPEIYLIKFIWAFAWFYSFGRTIFQFLSGKRSWSGRWNRDHFYVK